MLGHAVHRLRHGQQRQGFNRHEVHQGNRVRVRKGGDGEGRADGGPRLHFPHRVRNPRCHGLKICSFVLSKFQRFLSFLNFCQNLINSLTKTSCKVT